MHLGAIQTDCAKLQDARLLCQQEDLDEEILQLGQECASKRGKGIVIGMHIACDEAECHGLIRGALNLARAKDAGGIPIQQGFRLLSISAHLE